MAKQAAKILRVGIIQGGKIIEERLLRKREPVSIGQSPKNTFYVPISKLPRSLLLFDMKGETIFLSFNEETEGRVSFEDKVHSLADLRRHKAVTKKGNTCLLPLTEKSRGKIVLGDITLLFQFVPPPPVVPKPQLPASAKGGLGHAIMQESALLFAILASLIVQGGFIALSIAFETPPEKVKKKNVLLHSLKVDVKFDEDKEEPEPEPDIEAEPDQKDEGTEEPEPEPEAPPLVIEKPKPKPKPKPKTEKPQAAKPSKPTGGAKPKDLEALRRRRQAKLRNNTILKHITAAGVGGSAGPDALRQGHAERLSDAFKPAGGITVGKPGDVAGFRGGPKLEGEGGTARGTRVATLSKSERGAGRLKTGTVKTTTKKPEKRVKLRVGLRGGRKSGGIGKLDGSVVTKVLKRRSTAFRACYESRLKVNPGLSGKVVIKFTIGPAGRITNIKATSNSTGDTAVAQCIVNKVKRFRFNPPENGSVTFTYPIVLSKG